MKLDIGDTLAEAARGLASNAAPLARALLVPALLIAVSELDSESLFGTETLTWPLLYLAALSGYILLAVSTHRVLLLGPHSLASPWGLHFSAREVRFTGWLFGISLLLLPLFLLGAVLLVPLLRGLPPPILPLAFGLIGVPLFYIAARLSLALPAAAVDRRLTLNEVIGLSEGNGWRLTLVLAIPSWLLWTIAYAVESSWEVSGLLARLAFSALFALLGVLEIAALSTSYRALTSPGSSAAA